MDQNPHASRRPAGRHRRLLATLALALPLLAAACTDQPTAPSASSGRSAAHAGDGASNTAAEEKALGIVARTMALALSDAGLRHRIRNDLRAARNLEHKVPAQEYLKGASGGILLAKMAQRGDMSRDSLQRLLAAVRPLELYFPVPAHRGTWTGGEDLVVASALTEERDPVGYDLSGTQVALQRAAAPQLPTLVLTARETRFGDVAAAATPGVEARNELPDCYCVIDTLYPPPPAPFPRGRYLTAAYVYDLKEPWFRGSPEVEVHIHGPPDKDNPTYGADLSCASAGSPWPRNIDQNSHQWNGQTLLFTAEQNAAYAQAFADGYNVTFWEDDDTRCQIRLDNTSFRGALEAIRHVWGVVAVLPTKDPVKIGGAFIAMLYENASWLLTSDDFLGVLIPSEAAPWLAEGYNHVLFLDSGTYNGRAVLADY